MQKNNKKKAITHRKSSKGNRHKRTNKAPAKKRKPVSRSKTKPFTPCNNPINSLSTHSPSTGSKMQNKRPSTHKTQNKLK